MKKNGFPIGREIKIDHYSYEWVCVWSVWEAEKSFKLPDIMTKTFCDLYMFVYRLVLV